MCLQEEREGDLQNKTKITTNYQMILYCNSEGRRIDQSEGTSEVRRVLDHRRKNSEREFSKWCLSLHNRICILKNFLAGDCPKTKKSTNGAGNIALPNVHARVIRATELSICGNQSVPEMSSGDSRTFAAVASDWLSLSLASVSRRTRVNT